MSNDNTFAPIRRVLIGSRLRWCFVFIVLLMTAGNGLLLWQYSYVRHQREHLLGVDEELIAVLRFQTHLRSFHAKLNELAQSERTDRLIQESTDLQKSLIAHAATTRELCAGTVIGSGTVSNANYAVVGSGCIAEKRAIDRLNSAAEPTPYLKFNEQLRIEAVDSTGQLLFGSMDQRISAL